MKYFRLPIIRVGLALFLIAFLTVGIHLLRTRSFSALDYPTATLSSSAPTISIEIFSGMSGSEIASELFAKGVVASTTAFFRLAVSDARANKIAPGLHTLDLKISAAQALEQLLDAKRIPNLVIVSEGAWKSEVIASLLIFGFTKSEVLAALKKVSLPTGFSDVEGLLFPAQYSFIKGISATAALQSMIDRFMVEKKAQNILKGDKNFTALELLTIASMIQAEGQVEDFTKISQVIRNRLAIDMPLQLDATVQFVKKSRGNLFLSANSTLIKSPYNTYRQYGLPPGPIGSPGSKAMVATLSPAAGDWIYFITVAPRDTRFTNSHDEFLGWKRIYVKNRKAGAFEVGK